jgi:hypothetical protein
VVKAVTYILLLFVDVADLKPDVLFGQRAWGIIDNIFEALEHVSSRS